MVASLFAPATARATVAGYSVLLHNDSASTGTDCPDGVNDYWHFILAPNNGSYAFTSIILNVGGTTYTFTGFPPIIKNGSQTDNVFIAVPAGKTLGQLSASGSSAVISGPNGSAQFNLSHLCDGTAVSEPTTTTSTTSTTSTTVPDDTSTSTSSTTTSSTTTSSTTSTSSTTTSSTTTSSTTTSSTTTSTTIVSIGDFELDAVCNEVDVEGDVTTEWYDITNPSDGEVTVEWADGSTTIAGGATERVETAGPGISLLVGDESVGSADASDETCRRTVEFTKDVEGQPLSDVYTIRVSRLVPPNYVEEETFDITAGQTVTLDLPSTGDEEGFEYIIEEIDDGGASVHTVSPGTVTLAGHLGETVSVVILNSFAAIELDKQVSTTNVMPGDELEYTLIAYNSGALDLEAPTITDLLPPDVTLASWEIADDAGLCEVTEEAQPQLITCTMDDNLPVGGYTKAITLYVVVDADVAMDTVLLNQAKALAYYEEPLGKRVQRQSFRRSQVEAALSCVPIPDGAVCDLSAKIGSTITSDVTTTTDAGSGSGTTTTTSIAVPTDTNPVTTTTLLGSGSNLPRTGGASSLMMILGGMLVCLGGAVMGMSRRTIRV